MSAFLILELADLVLTNTAVVGAFPYRRSWRAEIESAGEAEKNNVEDFIN